MKRLLLAAAFVAFGFPALAGEEMTVYKSPWCGCCTAWIEHMEDAGYEVTVKEMEDVTPVKTTLGVPERLHSCHTARVGGYTIEGHVPAAEVTRLLKEKPKARGLSVPGMPIGSPGMEQGDTKEPYPVVLFSSDGMKLWARY